MTGLLQYRIGKDAIGKFLSFRCTPVRDDGIVGDPRTCFGQERIRPGKYNIYHSLLVFLNANGLWLRIEESGHVRMGSTSLIFMYNLDVGF